MLNLHAFSCLVMRMCVSMNMSVCYILAVQTFVSSIHSPFVCVCFDICVNFLIFCVSVWNMLG